MIFLFIANRNNDIHKKYIVYETLWNELSLVCMQHLKQFENWIFYKMDFFL